MSKLTNQIASYRNPKDIERELWYIAHSLSRPFLYCLEETEKSLKERVVSAFWEYHHEQLELSARASALNDELEALREQAPLVSSAQLELNRRASLSKCAELARVREKIAEVRCGTKPDETAMLRDYLRSQCTEIIQEERKKIASQGEVLCEKGPRKIVRWMDGRFFLVLIKEGELVLTNSYSQFTDEELEAVVAAGG